MSDYRKAARPQAEAFAHKAVVVWLPLLYCLISSLFFLRTYDSAQVKITMMQMGGLGLLTLWLIRLTEAGRAAFSRQDLVTLSPFLAYLGWGIFSFLKAPYHMASVDFFLRHVFYMVAALIIIYEFDEPAVQRLVKWLVISAWIAVGYGTLQFVDNTWFPRGPGKGIDPFVWRGAFGDRVFSTYGNPNFYGDFLVIVFPTLLMQYLKTWKWSYLPLMGMLLLNLAMTGTKGAWLGFAMVLAVFGVIAFAYFPTLKPYRAKVAGVILFGILGFVGYTAKDLANRVVSVNFRLFTWEATWEMIRTQPLTGSGVGSFPPLYPAFRRPPIFHIEGKHNTETDHAENEYIEQLFDNGILGFGIFLWMVFSTLFIGFKALGHMTKSLAEGRAMPPRVYELVGFLVAFCGMLGHNNFDVSLRFVSSGVYLGLLAGLIVNVARGKALYELHGARMAEAASNAPPPSPAARLEAEAAGPGALQTLADFLIWPARLAAVGGIVYLAFIHGYKSPLLKAVPLGGMYGEFMAIMGPLGRIPAGGDFWQWWLAWTTFLGCTVGLAYAMIRASLLSSNPVVPGLVLAMLMPLYMFWGYFKADVHHNIAIFFSKERQWEPAVANYLVVHRLNPDFVMSKYFLGNVFNDRFNMTKVYNPNWGDLNEVPMDDYERALFWYNEVRRLAPNYVQMHHQVGALHMKRAQHASDQGKQQEAEKYLDMAMTRFRLYEQIDPVFAPNYHRIAQIYMIRKDYAAAIKTYEALIDAEKCAVDPKLMEKPLLRRTILAYQPYLVEDGKHVHRHAVPVLPGEGSENWTALANAYYLDGRLEDAERAYLNALALNPQHTNAANNLKVVYGRAQAEGRLKKLDPPAAPPAPGMPPFTGLKVLPRGGR
ncbi:MAG: tetratricopeptide repeat protein [Elusimicrobiota bacterium]|nr:tetratricopeptide repeat protein [Elusimicrobiota bacterium]